MQDQQAGVLTAFLAVAASISLVVGGIGISNIMLVSVTERTREIGVRRAAGRHPRQHPLAVPHGGRRAGLLGGLIGVGLACAHHLDPADLHRAAGRHRAPGR